MSALPLRVLAPLCALGPCVCLAPIPASSTVHHGASPCNAFQWISLNAYELVAFFSRISVVSFVGTNLLATRGSTEHSVNFTSVWPWFFRCVGGVGISWLKTLKLNNKRTPKNMAPMPERCLLIGYKKQEDAL